MIGRAWFRPLLFLGIALAALIALASGLSQLELQPGRPFPLASLVRSLFARPGMDLRVQAPIGLLFAGVFWVLLVALLISLILSPALRRRALRILLYYLVWTLFFYYLVQRLQFQFRVPAPPGQGLQPQPEGATPLPTLPQFIAAPPPWLTLAFSAAVLLLALGLLWFFWARFRSRRGDDALELLAQEAQTALDELHAGGEVRDVVMRCYLEMTRILRERRNIRRQDAMTPREFEQHLAAVGVRDDHIHQLTRLFEAVRYGPRSAGQREERQALACLAAIAETYGRPR